MRPSGRKTDQMRKVSFERGCFQTCRRILPGQVRRHACAVHGEPRRQDAAMAAQQRQGLGDRRIRHAAARHRRAHEARGRHRQAERPHPGNPAPDRPLAARRGRPAGARRTPDLDRLRRHPGRWRHPHRLHHRRLDRAARLPDLDGSAQHDQGREGPEGPYRRDLLRHLRQPAGDRPRLSRRLRPPRPTPISS